MPSQALAITEYPSPEVTFARRQRMERLGDEITELAAHLHASQYQLLLKIGRFDAERGWGLDGIHSCAHWLNAQRLHSATSLAAPKP